MPLTPDLRRDPRYRALSAIPPVERTETDSALEITREFRGLTLEQAVGYLESLGGDRRDEGTVRGTDWTATLTAERQPVGPSYRLTTVRITWSGDNAVVEDIVFRFRLRAFRAPG